MGSIAEGQRLPSSWFPHAPRKKSVSIRGNPFLSVSHCHSAKKGNFLFSRRGAELAENGFPLIRFIRSNTVFDGMGKMSRMDWIDCGGSGVTVKLVSTRATKKIRVNPRESAFIRVPLALRQKGEISYALAEALSAQSMVFG